jgi:Ras-related protein Rap-1A
MKDKEGLVFVYAINSEESFDDVCNTLSLYEEIYAKKEIAP